MRTIAAALTTCALFLAAGLAGNAVPAGAQAPKAADPATPPKPDAKPAEPKKGSKPVKQTAVITMEKGGEIVIDFYPADAPKTVDNYHRFVRLYIQCHVA